MDVEAAVVMTAEATECEEEVIHALSWLTPVQVEVENDDDNGMTLNLAVEDDDQGYNDCTNVTPIPRENST